MTAVIVGRFQVPQLHLGHIYLISHCLQKFGNVGIALGTTNIRDEKNPYSVEHRKDIIRRIFPQVKVEILWDIPSDDKRWSMNLNELCFEHWSSPYFLCHSRDSFKDHYKCDHKLDLYEVPELPGYSGTEMRKSQL